MPLMQASAVEQQSLSAAQPVEFVITQPHVSSPNAQTPVQHSLSEKHLLPSVLQLV